jgi:hypothetical protein
VERAPLVLGEARGDPDVPERPAVVEEPEEERGDDLLAREGAEPGDDAVDGPLALHLHHHAPPGRVGEIPPLRDDPVDPGAVEALARLVDEVAHRQRPREAGEHGGDRLRGEERHVRHPRTL